MPRVAPPACCAASTEDQNVRILNSNAEIHSEVTQQADTVGIVAIDLATFEGQGINRAGRGRTFARLINELGYFGFVRNRNIEALAARTLKLAYRSFELLWRNLQKFVLNILSGLQGE